MLNRKFPSPIQEGHEMRIELPPMISLLTNVTEIIEAFGASNNVPEDKMFLTSLMVDELLTNYVRHSIQKVRKPKIEITVRVVRDKVVLQMIDTGPPFNPDDAPKPDLESDIDDRQIGGLGLHLVRTHSDRMQHRTNQVVQLPDDRARPRRHRGRGAGDRVMINKFECDVARHRKVVEIKPAGRLDSGQVSIFERILLNRINKGDRHIVINFRKVMFISSSGLRILLLGGKKTKERSGTLLLCSPRPQIRALFKSAGFEKLLAIREERDAAIDEAKVAAGCAGPEEPEVEEPAGGKDLGDGEERPRKPRAAIRVSPDFGQRAGRSGRSLGALLWTLLRPRTWFRSAEDDEDDDAKADGTEAKVEAKEAR